MRREAYGDAWIWARADLQNERGGYLLGTHGSLPDQRLYTMIEAFVPAIGGHGTRSSFRFTVEAWAHVETVLERDYGGLEYVGWFHTHPGHGIFLSKGYDTFIWDLWFQRNHQIAYVIDPCLNDEGFFVRHNGEQVHNTVYGALVLGDDVPPGKNRANASNAG